LSGTEDKNGRLRDALVALGGLLMLVDSVWGAIAALGLDLSLKNELALALSFVLGFPLYLLDFWTGKRIAFALIALFLFRWIALCFAGPVFAFCSPWPGSALLICAFLLLQWSKVQGRDSSLRSE
jgi:hypothetical protein